MKRSESAGKAPMENLSERDSRHIWHPLTQHKHHPHALPIERASGAYLYDTSGKAYIDGISSWYTCIYGHCHPYITGRVAARMQQLDQVVFAGLTHQPAVSLAESLIEILPDNQEKVFFSDNGSTAVEVALKMALQYHFNQGRKKDLLLAFESGFHGDTFGALSVSGLSVYNGPFDGMALEVFRIPPPVEADPQQTLAQLGKWVDTGRVAAFIYEPLVQGAAAMKTHHPEGLDRILGFLRTRGVLLVADEVMTGFGKTGTCFASEQLRVKPDLICLSKALSAGLLPLAVTTCTQEVYDAFYADEVAKGFFHGHTYTANPLACEAALAALELYQSSEIQDGLKRVMESHREFAARMEGHPMVAEIRHIGAILALDIRIGAERYGDLRQQLYQRGLENGVYLRPLGRTLYTLPPYVISQEALGQIYSTMESLLDYCSGLG
ncbi:adenosylmethionine--8-amino-7-oxononanoate transaminase [Robiginitalea sediminis]|uniref:adenosylmethionine--8-amino-7-oxononanoate transaminase n=1 Tax=Robiginitalea sediminis TaxID=1982593 RepID=UPI001E498338|nr:adenosylmethionine--8-amino-7-oxononanoate transaminase [Robiginitalea sediminis]